MLRARPECHVVIVAKLQFHKFLQFPIVGAVNSTLVYKSLLFGMILATIMGLRSEEKFIVITNEKMFFL